ncbi:hypothetical protein [Bradyrhizobium icense]|uniref:Uncharacterized protein n=1 Tax=Bradyrhizobium icense TaxID=1274631 RepID=A0A1B1U8J0_9BRAD|nr:hypothetical protein [Bradyrhizobium icense]ANV99062.1 hypothetical protein LMTR13_01500 [Bradyrhizobium icense]
MVGFPLLLIPLAIYNIIVFLMPEVSFTDPLVRLTLVSGAEWTVTLSDVLLTLSILLLLAEVIKGARPGAKYLTDHLLSLIVFGAAAAEFLLWPKFGTSTYFLMTALSLVDFISGLALRTRRRGVAAAAPVPPAKGAEKAEAPAAEPKIEPAPAAAPSPAPATPAAASVAESVLKDHAEPKPVQPAAAPEATSPPAPSPAVSSSEVPEPEVPAPQTSAPRVPSPGLQPGSGPPPSDKPDDTPQR